jgi:hypothetical protein
MPLISYLSICEYGFTMFCIVFHVRNVTFVCVSLKIFALFFVFLPLCVKVAHLVFRCYGSVFMICSCWLGVSYLGLYYIYCCVACFMMFSFFCFASFVIRYVCNVFTR